MVLITRNARLPGEMVIRIYMLLVLVAAILGFWGLSWLKRTPPEIVAKTVRQIGWFAALLLLVLLTLTGKLNWLFGLLGLAVAFIVRSMPVILRYAPQLHRLWAMFYAGKGQKQSSSPPRTAAMSQAEALEVLGLKAGASETDIVAAHRKLIARLHPDKGGSDYLAAQINLAKKVLLRR